MAVYSLEPVDVPRVQTAYRTIRTKLPVPESLPIFESLRRSEPQSMMGQPPVVWHAADDCTVSDPWGNRWLDWSSCVLVSNAGHGAPEIREALTRKIEQGLLATYVFVHEDRAKLTAALQALAPDPPNYRNAFHGRTLGAQLAGGMEKLKHWIVDRDPSFVQVPFPDGYKNEDTRFDLFLESLAAQGVRPESIAGVMTESYQGVGPDFLPPDYAQALAAFCRQHDIVLILDEVQAGFGRTGRMFGYEHYGIAPDLIACGKGITSSLPLAAVIGRADIMGLYGPGSMTSTHSGSPLCVAASLANLEVFRKRPLVENAAAMGGILIPGLDRIRARHPAVLGCLHGKGLVAGIQVVRPGTREPDPETATAVNETCFHKGLLLFAPVGVGGECLKIAPPLTIAEEPLRESLAVFEEAVDEVLAGR